MTYKQLVLTTDEVQLAVDYYEKQDIIGIAYAVNDALSISYNIIEESNTAKQQMLTSLHSHEQETDLN